MNEWFRRLIEQIREQWAKWTMTQKVVLFAIIGAGILAIILLVTFSSSPSAVPLLTAPITDEVKLNQISVRLDEESIQHTVTPDGRIMLEDKKTQQRAVGILMREDLIPSEVSPWDIFKMDRWTLTDFERNVNLRQTIEKNLEMFIEALDEVDSAEVTLVLPETTLFAEDQKPTTASIIITPKPGSDILGNRKKIEGIQKLVIAAVEGLQDENVVITDYKGLLLNDFTGLAEIDRLELTKREIKTKEDFEERYRSQILKELSAIFGPDRVRVMKVEINLDTSKKTVEETEYFPVTVIADNPATPFDETQVELNVPRSVEQIDEEFRGTGFNPEGPPGQEGQTPPAYKDLEGLVGEYSNNSQITNYEVNERNTFEEKSPWAIEKITVGVAIDGIWRWSYDEKGVVELNPDGSIMREYTAVPDEDLGKAKKLVEHAIGYERIRGDSVTVEHIQFDRTAQHVEEDQRFRNQARMRQMILYSIIGLAVMLVIFVVVRLVSREVERRRRLREEELSRQHQAMREAALRSAEEEGMDVQMSVEERARLEMQENAINMAREHPEDVAQLIRTWLVEE